MSSLDKITKALAIMEGWFEQLKPITQDSLKKPKPTKWSLILHLRSFDNSNNGAIILGNTTKAEVHDQIGCLKSKVNILNFKDMWVPFDDGVGPSYQIKNDLIYEMPPNWRTMDSFEGGEEKQGRNNNKEVHPTCLLAHHHQILLWFPKETPRAEVPTR